MKTNEIPLVLGSRLSCFHRFKIRFVGTILDFLSCIFGVRTKLSIADLTDCAVSPLLKISISRSDILAGLSSGDHS